MSIQKHFKNLFSDSVIYGISGIITSLIGLLLIPLYTKVFNPEEYGKIALLTSVQTLISIAVIFAMDNSFLINYYAKPNEIDRLKSLNSWFFFSLLLGAILAIVLVASSNLILTHVLNDTSLKSAVFFLSGSVFLASTQKIPNIWFRAKRSPVGAVIYSLLISLLTIGLNIYLILYKKNGVNGIFISSFISSFISLIITFIIFKDKISLIFLEKENTKKMLKLSLPLVPVSLIYWLMSTATPHFLNILIKSKSEIGLYQIGNTFSSVIGLATFAFFQAYSTYALSIANEKNVKEFYAKVFHYYILAGLFFALILGLLSKFILTHFTNSKFIDAKYVIGILAFNLIIGGSIQIISIANMIAQKNKEVAISSFVAVFFTIISYFLLIPTFGKEGAALALLIGNFIGVSYLIYKAQKLYFIPYNLKIIVIEIIIFAFVYIYFVQII